MNLRSRALFTPSAIRVLLFVLFAAALPGAVRAQDTNAAPTGWQFDLTPYLWFASLKGTLGAEDQTASVDAKFGDIFDKVKFAGMMTFQAHREKLSLLLDLNYIDLQDEVSPPGPAFSSIKTTSKTFMASPVAGWRVAQDEKSFADVLAGLRIWSAKNDLDFTAGQAPELKASSTLTWVDPVIGGRWRTALSPKWSASLLGDFGGFGIGSKFTWQIAGAFHLNVGRGDAIVLGYRYLDVDYHKSGSVYDVQQYGPLLGFTFRL